MANKKKRASSNAISIAKKTLNRAMMELHHANDEEDRRQAAEKAWRAAREAVYGVMDVVGEKPREKTIGIRAVSAFESKYLTRSRGRQLQPLSVGYHNAMDRLHGMCFYENVCSSEKELEYEMFQVACLIEQAEDDIVLLEGSRR